MIYDLRKSSSSTVPNGSITLPKLADGTKGAFITYDALNKAIETENVSTSVDLSFDYFDARFFGELGLPDLQGWSSTNSSLVADTIFGVEKNNIKFVNGSADKPLTAENWTDILIEGASYSSVMRIEAISGGMLTGFGFSATNDPRPSSSIGRFLLKLGESAGYIYIQPNGLGTTVVLDGSADKPLVLLDDYFHFECKINPSPDSGVTFGDIEAYINGILVATSTFVGVSSTVASDKIIMKYQWGGADTSTYYIDNFGITIYEESSTKLLTEQEMSNDSINLIVPSGKRDYTAILPDDSPRKVGNTFSVVASNATGNITLRTQDLNAPQVLFNGQNEYSIYIESKKSIIFTNSVDNNNVYQGFIPHEDVMKHDHLGLTNLNIFSVQDLENAFGDAGTYEITSDVNITFMNDIVIPDVFNIASGVDFIMQAANHALSINFTNTGTIFTHAGLGQFRLTQGTFSFSGANATLFNLSVTSFIVDWTSLLCAVGGITLGSITASSIFKITNSTIGGFTNGFIIDTDIFTMSSNFFKTTTLTTNTVIRLNNVSLAATINDIAFIVGVDENLFYINPAITSQFYLEGAASSDNVGNFFEAGSQTEASKYVIVEKAGKQINSNTGTAMSSKANTVDTTILATPEWNPLNLGTATLGELNSRFTLTDATTGEREYTGRYPIKVGGSVSFGAKRGTAGVGHSFRISKNFSDQVPITPFDTVEASVELGIAVVQGAILFSGILYPGDKFRPEVNGEGSTTSITIVSYSDIIQ
jgi:hypothetical protein